MVKKWKCESDTNGTMSINKSSRIRTWTRVGRTYLLHGFLVDMGSWEILVRMYIWFCYIHIWAEPPRCRGRRERQLIEKGVGGEVGGSREILLTWSEDRLAKRSISTKDTQPRCTQYRRPRTDSVGLVILFSSFCAVKKRDKKRNVGVTFSSATERSLQGFIHLASRILFGVVPNPTNIHFLAMLDWCSFVRVRVC